MRKIIIHQLNETSIAEVVSDEIIIRKTQDVLDIMGDCFYHGSKEIILHQKNITEDFFDLRTRIAGDILQKFSTYDVRLAIVGDFSIYSGKSLKDFISESNTFGRINFVSSINEAKEKLNKK